MGRQVGIAPVDLQALLLLQDLAGSRSCPWATGRCAAGSSWPPGRRHFPGSGCSAGTTSASPAPWAARAGGRAAAAAAHAAARHGAARHARRAPRIVSRICSVERLRSSSCMRARWPPAMWPLSCAMTPISWLGVSVRMIRPVLMKMRWPPATKALSELSWTIMISIAVGIETGRPPDRHDQGADGVLDLGVADEIESLTLLRARGTKRRQREERETEEGDDASEHGRHGSLGRLGTLGGRVNCAPWRWRACSCWQLVAEVRRTAKATRRPTPPIRPACRRAGAAFPRIVADGVRSPPCRPTKAAPPRSAATSCRAAATPPMLRSPCISPWRSPCRRRRASAPRAPASSTTTRPRPPKPSSFRRSPRPGTVDGQPFSVPSGVRAITLMHVRHGQLRWEQTVAPAERLARFGVPVSRALSRDLQAGGGAAGQRPRDAAHLRQGRGRHGDGRRYAGRRPSSPARWARSASAAAANSSRARWRAPCPSRCRRWAAACRSRRCATPCRRRGRRPPRVLWPPRGLCRAAAGGRRRGAGRLERPGAGWPDAGRFRRLLRPGRGRQQGGRGRLHPVDGPALRRARDRARHRRAAGRGDARRGSVSPVIIANPNNGEFTFAGAGGGAPTAAQATGAWRARTVEEDQPLAVLTSRRRAGRLRQRHRLPVGPAQQRRDLPQRHRSGRRRTGAARPLGAIDVGQALAPRRRGRSVHRHGRHGGRRREGGGGRHRHPSRSRPAQHARAQGRACRRPRRPRQRPHRLCRRTRHSGAARAHRAALSRGLRRRRSRPSA